MVEDKGRAEELKLWAIGRLRRRCSRKVGNGNLTMAVSSGVGKSGIIFAVDRDYVYVV